MQRKDHRDLAEVVHRGSDREWLDRAQQSRRKWVRRNIAIGAVVVVAVLIIGFLVNEGPRRSGMLDALGVTCDEFVVGSGPSQEQFFEQWDDHRGTLERSLEEGHPDDDADFDAAAFVTDVEEVAEELGAEPVSAVFRGWTPPSRELSLQVLDGKLLVGHHEQLWTRTDGVSLVDPVTGEADWSAELEHPFQEDWQEPERVLYGVGVFGERVLLQTPTVSGDTALVILGTAEQGASECLRLDGDLDPVEVLDEQPGAWPMVMNINLGRVSDDEFLIAHGLEPGEQTHLSASKVDIVTQEVEEAGEYSEAYPSASGSVAPQQEVVELGEDHGDQEPVSVQQLGDTHYLFTWQAGDVLFERDG